jgi:hypothetical protein
MPSSNAPSSSKPVRPEGGPRPGGRLEKSDPAGRTEGPRARRLSTKDISGVLKGWDYESGVINVRKIIGADGATKLQMRVDLGLLQMEMEGRPDGARPHGCESLLDYQEAQLKDHEQRNGTELGFHLTGDQCQDLREEASQYYQRYLSLLVLGDYSGVVRDTAHNLRVLDLCGKYAVEEQDRLILEQYRPYIIMNNSRAAASIEFNEKRYPQALRALEAGLKDIRDFFSRFGQDEAYRESNEVKVLRKFAREIRRKLPADPLVRLQHQLDRAVKREHYEEAARLRDRIKARKGRGASE